MVSGIPPRTDSAAIDIFQAERMPAPRSNPQLAPPLQFRLRTLLAAMAIVGVMLAVAVRLEATWSLVLFWSLVLVAAHVVGNAFGTKQRRRTHSADDAASEQTPPAAIVFAPATPLRASTSLARSMLIATSAGAVLGAVLGMSWLLWAYFAELGTLGVAVGACSGALLGGLAGFLASSFIGIAGRAFRHAARGSGS